MSDPNWPHTDDCECGAMNREFTEAADAVIRRDLAALKDAGSVVEALDADAVEDARRDQRAAHLRKLKKGEG